MEGVGCSSDWGGGGGRREVKRSVWDARWRVAGADVHHMNRTRVV